VPGSNWPAAGGGGQAAEGKFQIPKTKSQKNSEFQNPKFQKFHPSFLFTAFASFAITT
jgi:hypothetical protein